MLRTHTIAQMQLNTDKTRVHRPFACKLKMSTVYDPALATAPHVTWHFEPSHATLGGLPVHEACVREKRCSD